jgi:large subunit ribosomal protein L32
MTIRLEIDLCEAEGLSERNFTDHAESETKTFSEAHLHPAGPNCHEKKMPHRACVKCGYYKGREVLDVEEAS